MKVHIICLGILTALSINAFACTTGEAEIVSTADYFTDKGVVNKRLSIPGEIYLPKPDDLSEVRVTADTCIQIEQGSIKKFDGYDYILVKFLKKTSNECANVNSGTLTFQDNIGRSYNEPVSVPWEVPTLVTAGPGACNPTIVPIQP